MSVKVYLTLNFLSIIASIVLGHTATAGDLFATQDKNADGVLSGSEAILFKPFDTDQDSEITKKEVDAAIAKHCSRVNAQDRSNFEARDGNQDGRLSGTEIRSCEFTDLDDDGRIPLSEFLDGMVQYRRKLAMTMEELTFEAARRFKLLDLNEDNRLSGTEALHMSCFDFNDDNRITLDEFTLDLLLDSALTNESPNPQTIDPIKTVVDAINQQDFQTMYGVLRPELQKVADEIVLSYLIRHVAASHGRLSIPDKADIDIQEGEQRGSRVYSAKPSCEIGQLSLRLVMLEGGVLGLSMESPEVDRLNDQMFDDLFADKNNTLKKFADFYARDCGEMIRLACNGDDSKAFGMFHPQIQKQIGVDPFTKIFMGLRKGCGETDSVRIELEEAGVEFDENGKGKFFTIAHRVVGPSGVMLFRHKIQFVGLKAYFVAASIEPVDVIETVDTPSAPKPSVISTLLNLMSPKEPTSKTPMAPPPTTPATDDDDPVSPPAPRKLKP